MTFWKTAALTAAILGAAGIGAAVSPVAHAQRTRVATASPVQVLSIGGGRIGVSVSDLEADAAAKTTGVRIESVEEGSPAEKAGFRSGDIVVEFDGERVRSVRQFTRLVGETPAGRSVVVNVMREGGRVTLNVTPRDGSGRFFEGDSWRALDDLRTFSHTLPRTAEPLRREIEVLAARGTQLGITTQELSPQLAEYFGAKDGVLVSSVREDSAAAKAGVKAGDVITAVNGNAIGDASALRRELQRVERGGKFSLSVMRDRKSVTLEGTIEAPSPRRWTARTIL